MDIMELGAIGELVGGAAVVASLIFVGLQIRSNARSIQINSTLNVLQTWANANEYLCQDDELSNLLQAAMRSEHPDEVDIDGRLNFFFRSLMHRLEAEYFLYTRGLVDPEIWTKHLSWFQNLTSTPTGRRWWEREIAESRIYTEAFIQQLQAEA